MSSRGFTHLRSFIARIVCLMLVLEPMLIGHAPVAFANGTHPPRNFPPANRTPTNQDADLANAESTVRKFGEVESSVQQAGVPPKPCLACVTTDVVQETGSKAKSALSDLSKIKSVKDSKQMARWVSCYLQSDEKEGKRAYSAYKKNIAAAAKAFELPEALLTCIIFRENRFKLNGVSTAGAIGIAQIMPVTVGFIDDKVSKLGLDEADVQYHQDIISPPPPAPKVEKPPVTPPAPAETASTKRSGAGKNKVVKKQAKAKSAAPKSAAASSKKKKRREVPPNIKPSDISNAKGELIKYGLAKRWESYFKSMGRKAPRKFTIDDAKNPVTAIGGQALYLRYILDRLNTELNKKGSFQAGSFKAPEAEFLAIAAGAYNAGHGTAFKLLGAVQPSLSSWRKALNNWSKETANYMTSVANCMEHGTMKPITGDEERSCD